MAKQKQMIDTEKTAAEIIEEAGKLHDSSPVVNATWGFTTEEFLTLAVLALEQAGCSAARLNAAIEVAMGEREIGRRRI